jgi:hypothetical protein
MKQDFENSLLRRYHELFSHFKAFLLEDISHVFLIIVKMLLCSFSETFQVNLEAGLHILWYI